ncbi:MAG: CBS-domain-containing membrane protein [Pseudohongiellaceae bacterium]
MDYLPLLDDHGKVFGIIDNSVLKESRQADAPEASINPWEICNRSFNSAGPDSSVEEIIAQMKSTVNHNGFVVIAEEGRYLNAITSDYLIGKTTIKDESPHKVDAVVDS